MEIWSLPGAVCSGLAFHRVGVIVSGCPFGGRMLYLALEWPTCELMTYILKETKRLIAIF